MTYSVSLGATETTSPLVVESTAIGLTDVSDTRVPPAGVPLTMPKSQRYYWTSIWRSGEARNLAELEAGLGIRFQSPTDAVRWLLGD